MREVSEVRTEEEERVAEDVFVDPAIREHVALKSLIGKYRQITKLAIKAHDRNGAYSNKNVRERAVLHFLEMLENKIKQGW